MVEVELVHLEWDITALRATGSRTVDPAPTLPSPRQPAAHAAA